MRELIWLVPILPLVGFIINGLGRKTLSKNVAGFIGCATVFISFILVAGMFIQQRGDTSNVTIVKMFDWIHVGTLSIPVAFQIDSLSILMMLIVTGVGFLIHVYSVGYMHHDEGFHRFMSYLNLFIFFMLLLVSGSNYLMLFIGWEGVGLCSYLLIGFWFSNTNYNVAAKKAFIVNRIGDLGFLLGMLLLFKHFGTLNFLDIQQLAPFHLPASDKTIMYITLLLFIGAVGKSAQIPLFVWLPDAMAGPTPVSALIHAATMVTAGVYLVVRSNFLFTASPETMAVIAVIGLATALFAATIGLFQNDIKKVLAYSTVSQLGYLFLALGVGAFTGSMFHLMTHAFFKALLFLGAGSVIHGMSGEQDMRKMGGLKKYMPVTYWTFLIATLAISGIFPFAGFFSKDEILAFTYQHNKFYWFIAVLTSLMTSFYMFRLFFLTFHGEFRGTHEQEHHLHESPKSMTIPLMILAVLSTVGGFLNIPGVFGGGESLHHFLEPVYAKAQNLPEMSIPNGTQLALMFGVMALVLVMIYIAYNLFVVRKRIPVSDETPVSGLQNAIYHKYYIDEIYDAAVISVTLWLSKFFFNIIETLGIDNLSVLIGKSAIGAGKGLRRIQTGKIGTYVFVFVAGVVIILLANYYW